jgi:Raffinose synthase or seed imbibition protein Sip1
VLWFYVVLCFVPAPVSLFHLLGEQRCFLHYINVCTAALLGWSSGITWLAVHLQICRGNKYLSQPDKHLSRGDKDLSPDDNIYPWVPYIYWGKGCVSSPCRCHTPQGAEVEGRGPGAGVTGVKVDCQAGVGLVGSTLGGGPAVASHYQSALEDSIARHFPGNHAINCMCHSTENIYRCVSSPPPSGGIFPRDFGLQTSQLLMRCFCVCRQSRGPPRRHRSMRFLLMRPL